MGGGSKSRAFLRCSSRNHDVRKRKRSGPDAVSGPLKRIFDSALLPFKKQRRTRIRNVVRRKTATIPELKLFEEFIHRFVERNGIVVSNEMIALDEHQFSVGQTAVNKLSVSAFDQILRAHNN